MNIAIVGGGISGLAAAHALTQAGAHRVTLFEAGPTLGGHTHTVDVTLDGITHPVDTGFLVFNRRTYPNLVRLFDQLGVPVAPSGMSFSVSLGGALEWAGTDLGSVFAQPSNLVNPRFLSMLRDILAFNRAATRAARAGVDPAVTLGAWLQRAGFGAPFRDWYLLPMAGAIWSCPTATMLATPFATFARFCDNHGLLQVRGRPQWFTVRGGGREYVHRIAARLGDVRVNAPVEAVRRVPGGVLVRAGGATERFDEAVLACHSDQALAILGDDARAAERAVLAAIPYQANAAWLHTDTALLPRRRRAWAAWNYLSAAPNTPDVASRPVAVSYLINQLQPLPFTTPVIVTLNPFTTPDPAKVIARFDYAHPVFDAGAIAAQAGLSAIQGAERLWFAGAWTGYGFHEDGLKSGLAVAAALAARSSGARDAATHAADPPRAAA